MTKKRKREGVLYGTLTVLVLLLVGADLAYFNILNPSKTAQASSQEGHAATVGTDNECVFNTEIAPVEDLSVLIDERDPQTGNPDGAVTVIEIFDPNCPHCKSLHPIMKSLVAQYGETVRFVYKPIWLPQFRASIVQNAVLFAANQEGKFSEMLDLQFEGQQRGGLTGAQLKELAARVGMDAEAMEQRINEGYYDDLIERGNKQVVEVGVSSVPTVLINGRFVSKHSRSEACLGQFIEAELQNANAEG